MKYLFIAIRSRKHYLKDSIERWLKIIDMHVLKEIRIQKKNQIYKYFVYLQDNVVDPLAALMF